MPIPIKAKYLIPYVTDFAHNNDRRPYVNHKAKNIRTPFTFTRFHLSI